MKKLKVTRGKTYIDIAKKFEKEVRKDESSARYILFRMVKNNEINEEDFWWLIESLLFNERNRMRDARAGWGSGHN